MSKLRRSASPSIGKLPPRAPERLCCWYGQFCYYYYYYNYYYYYDYYYDYDYDNDYYYYY